MAVHAFKKTVIKKRTKTENLINFGGSEENLNRVPVQSSNSLQNDNLLIPLETASVGTASDCGYSSGLLSTEDLSRQQPVAGGMVHRLSDCHQIRAYCYRIRAYCYQIRAYCYHQNLLYNII